MGFKERTLERIEKDAIKVNINGEIVYLKKSGIMKEWHLIHPPINPETKKVNWMNFLFGGWGYAFKIFFIGVLILLFSLGINFLINLVGKN